MDKRRLELTSPVNLTCPYSRARRSDAASLARQGAYGFQEPLEPVGLVEHDAP